MRRIAVLGLIVLTAGPAPASAAPPPHERPAGAPHANLHSRNVPPRDRIARAGLPGIAARSGSLREIADAVAARLSAPPSEGGPGLRKIADSEDPDYFHRAYVSDWKDLDGDGKADLLSFEDLWSWTSSSEDKLLVRALSGADGEEIWSTGTIVLSDPQWSAVPGISGGRFRMTFASVDDWSGSGEHELLVFEFGYSVEIPVTVVPLLQRLHLFSAEDGRKLWTRELGGSLTMADALVGNLLGPAATARYTKVENLLTGLYSIVDTSNDGSRDFYTATYDAERLELSETDRFDVTSRGTAIDARTGVPAESHETSGAGFAELVPMPPIGEPGPPDVAVVTGSSIELRSFDLSASRWKSRFPAATYSYAFTQRLTGPVHDVVIYALTIDWEAWTFEQQLIVLRADSGARVWSIFSDGWLTFAGDLQGRGAGDLLHYRWTNDSTVNVEALSGADGGILWAISERAAPSNDGTVWLYAGAALDLTGDGITDPTFVREVFVDDEEGYVDTVELSMRALDGSTRAPLWSYPPVQRWQDLPYVWYDVDRDGGHDLYLERDSADGTALLIDYLRGDTLAPIASLHRADWPDGWWPYTFAADVTGDGRLDIGVTANGQGSPFIEVWDAGEVKAWEAVIAPPAG